MAIVARFVALLMHWYLIVVELILGLGFVLQLLGANPSSEFVKWAYRSLDRAMGPFSGIFDPVDIGQTGGGVSAVFDTTILFAMVAYGLLLVAVDWLLAKFTQRVRRIDYEERLDAQREAYRNAAASGSGLPDVVGAANASQGVVPQPTTPPANAQGQLS